MTSVCIDKSALYAQIIDNSIYPFGKYYAFDIEVYLVIVMPHREITSWSHHHGSSGGAMEN